MNRTNWLQPVGVIPLATWLVGGHTRDSLLRGRARDPLCGSKTDLLCGHTRDLLCGHVNNTPFLTHILLVQGESVCVYSSPRDLQQLSTSSPRLELPDL